MSLLLFYCDHRFGIDIMELPKLAAETDIDLIEKKVIN